MNLLKKALDYMERIIAIKKQLGVLFKHGKDELLTEYDIDVIDDILSVYDVYIGIPLDTFRLMQMYAIVTCLFIFLTVYLYVKKS